MGAKIKLQRKGAKNKPFYRVVVQDESKALKSTVIEVLGSYDPLKEPTLFDVDKEKTKAWLDKGAEPTEKVRILLGKAGLMPPVDLAALPKRKSKAEQKAEAEAKPEEKPAEGGAEAPTDPRAISHDLLMAGRFCTNEEDCRTFAAIPGCFGHFSWTVTFQRSY